MGLDPMKYTGVLDHNPNDFTPVAAGKVFVLHVFVEDPVSDWDYIPPWYLNRMDMMSRTAVACEWIKNKQISAVAVDNLGVDAIPFDPEGVKLVSDVGFKGFPVHADLLVHQGVALGEIWNFEGLALDCSVDGVYEFMLIAPPLRIVGGVGSPLSPLAIK